MVIGQFGVNGIPAVNPVEVVCRNGLGAARNPRPVLAGNLAKEKRGKTVGATHIHVLVCKEDASHFISSSLLLCRRLTA